MKVLENSQKKNCLTKSPWGEGGRANPEHHYETPKAFAQGLTTPKSVARGTTTQKAYAPGPHP